MPSRSRTQQSSGASTGDPEIADLYGLLLAEFTPGRNALAARLSRSGQQEAAEVVKALKKSTPPVWAITQVARNDSAVVQDFVTRLADYKPLNSSDVLATSARQHAKSVRRSSTCLTLYGAGSWQASFGTLPKWLRA